MSYLIKILTVCPVVFEFSICYSLDLLFFEKLQTKILSSTLVVRELMSKVQVRCNSLFASQIAEHH